MTRISRHINDIGLALLVPAQPANVRNRRMSLILVCPGGGRLIEPTPAIRPRRQERVFVPLTQPCSTLGWLQLTLEHPLVGADQVPRRLAKDSTPTILHSTPEVFVAPSPV